MAVTKQGLIEAAEKCFNKPAGMWWGYPDVTTQSEYEHCYGWTLEFADFDAWRDGDYSVWFLLLCAEMVGED